jgi:RNA polymerase sigma factor (sigma-70 family)
MHDTSSSGLELTPDLTEYAKAVALKVAQQSCPPHVDFEDAVQEAMLSLMSALPKYDASKKAAPKTFIHLVVQRAVAKYADREHRKLKPLRSFGAPAGADSGPSEEQVQTHRRMLGRWASDHDAGAARVDEALELLGNEDSRKLCRLLIEHNGNVSETARQLNIPESTVRYRLQTLAPKFLAAGFDPFGGTEP